MQPLLTVSLRHLFPTASFIGCANIQVSDARCSSYEIVPRSMFAVIAGRHQHGQEFIADAVRRGATSLLVETPHSSWELPQCVVPDVREAYARICHALFADPTRNLEVVGVTGTNGKTTTTWLVRSIIEAARGSCGLLGTIENSDGIGHVTSTLTTPGSRDLAMTMASTRKNLARYATLELSSHALDQKRSHGTQLDVAIITNLTQDHFDYHGSLEHYRSSKARIFSHLKHGGTAVLNADDPAMEYFRSFTRGTEVITFGMSSQSDVRGELIEQTAEGTHFRVTIQDESVLFFTPLIGSHNVSNALAAIAGCRKLGLSLEEMRSGIERLRHVPGRLQQVALGQPCHVWVDYAHTEDGLQRAIAALRPLVSGRLTVVFGAGGDRDPGKRPQMGRAASAADQAIITNDNPRSEQPEAIAAAILAGWCRFEPPEIVLDREVAIRSAIHASGPGDGVLVAGKGHEKFQIIGSQQIPFDDLNACLDAILSHPLRISWPASPRFRRCSALGQFHHLEESDRSA